MMRERLVREESGGRWSSRGRFSPHWRERLESPTRLHQCTLGGSTSTQACRITPSTARRTTRRGGAGGGQGDGAAGGWGRPRSCRSFCVASTRCIQTWDEVVGRLMRAGQQPHLVWTTAPGEGRKSDDEGKRNRGGYARHAPRVLTFSDTKCPSALAGEATPSGWAPDPSPHSACSCSTRITGSRSSS